LAAVPAIAILIETVIFLSIASLVDRERPPVVKLDVAPPTSSYPSGHAGASTALYLAFAFLALHIARAWLRWTTIFLCLITPRLYEFKRGCPVHAAALCGLVTVMWLRIRRW